MLSTEENELLTQVGPGTPGGDLMRKYWHPIAATETFDSKPVQKVRILGRNCPYIETGQANMVSWSLIAPIE